MNENVILSGAEQDLFGHYRSLELQAEGLGDRMNGDILHALDLLARNPRMGSPQDNSVRKWSLLEWKLGIYYTVEGSRNMILAVQHLRQNPKTIRVVLRSRMPR